MVVPVILAGFSFWAGLKYRDTDCKALLSTYVLIDGSLQIGGILVALLDYGRKVSEYKDVKCLEASLALYSLASLIAGLVIVIMGIIGLHGTWAQEDREDCGLPLWWVANVMFIWMPSLNLGLCCCLTCCLVGLIAMTMAE